MRAVLQEPAFQALEARWRALELLVSRADEAVEIAVLDVTRAELLADLLPRAAPTPRTRTPRSTPARSRGACSRRRVVGPSRR